MPPVNHRQYACPFEWTIPKSPLGDVQSAFANHETKYCARNQMLKVESLKDASKLLQSLLDVSCGDISTRFGWWVAGRRVVAVSSVELGIVWCLASVQVASTSASNVIDWCHVCGLLHLYLKFLIEGEHSWWFIDMVSGTPSACDEWLFWCEKRLCSTWSWTRSIWTSGQSYWSFDGISSTTSTCSDVCLVCWDRWMWFNNGVSRRHCDGCDLLEACARGR